MAKGNNKRIRWLSKQLANHYTEGIKNPIACACSGLDGTCLGCSIWWELFLTSYSRANIEHMVELYLVATRGY